MSEQATQEVETRDPLTSKVVAQLNEEKLTKDLNAVQLGRFKTLDEIGAEIAGASEEKRGEVRKLLEENIGESPESLVSRYLLGKIALQDDDARGAGEYLKDLLDRFIKAAKWTIVDHIADQILESDDKNRFALRAKVDSTERLKGKKELAPYLERLAQIDRKNPDVVRKYGLSILEEDPERALQHLKSAAETYARQKDYKNLEDIWNLAVQHDPKDLQFFERIERILAGNRERTRIAAYLVSLVEPHRSEENWDVVITLLKKILEYEPASSRARSDLVRAYRSRYETHSLLNEFLKMSELTNHKRPVGPCIASFERNIVFDKDNFVYHRTRGVGKIAEIDHEQVIVDFAGNPGQRMSIQMAISSLQPLTPDHFWVRLHESPGDLEEAFKEDLPFFFEMLLSSFGHKMTLSEIKAELVPRFLTATEWSKWWSRARNQLKKDPRFGFNPRKKDELILRETPVTFSEELSMKFQSLSDWNQKLDLALDTLKDQEAEGAAELCIQFFRENETNKDLLKQLHSYLFLELAADALEEDIPERRIDEEAVKKLFKEAEPKEILRWSAETGAADIKREIMARTVKYRKQDPGDHASILKEFLFEVPIKINRQALTELNRMGETEALKDFEKRVFRKYRDNPEVFLWTAKSILTGQWNYPWIQHGRDDILLLVFRLLKPLASIEKKGTRLKNSAMETIFGTTNITVEALKKNEALTEMVQNAPNSMLRRMYALFREAPYVPDAHKENFYSYLKELRSDFSMDYDEDDSESPEPIVEGEAQLFPAEGEIVASRAAIEKRKTHLEHLINVEMPANSRDIGEAMEKGDLRENAEYKAALERQSQLQAEITRLSQEVKKARAIEPGKIRTDLVALGSKVRLKTDAGESETWAILGPWDADTENSVISYASPLAKALAGKKPGETAKLGDKEYAIEAIESAL